MYIAAHSKTVHLILVLAVIIAWFWHPSLVKATQTCTASVTPASVTANSEITFEVTINNTGTEEGLYIAIYTPSDNFSLINYGVPGWTVNSGSSSMEMTGGSIPAGTSIQFDISANTADTEAASADWWVGVSYGGVYQECTGGPFGTAISGYADSTAPVLSEPSVSGASSSSVTIGWTTNEAADSYLNYGLTYGSYPGQVYEATLSTSHSITLTGLAANTTYYYEYRSVDGSGNASAYKDFYTFTTSAVGAPTSTPAPTSTSTSTTINNTIINTATPTPTPPDNAKPIIRLTTSLTNTFVDTPIIEGKVTDSSLISSIEYSVDGGKTWQPVDQNPNPNTRVANFSFLPSQLNTGEYALQIRATDEKGNTGVYTGQTLKIDQTPPTIASDTDLSQNYPQAPTFTGTVSDNTGVASVEYSTDGGQNWLPANLIFEADPSIGIFSFTPGISQDADYPMVIRSTDSAGNISLHKLGDLVIDRLPPKVGGVIYSIGPQLLKSNNQGHIVSLAGASQTITVSLVGGPTQVTIEVAGQKYELTQSLDSGLWKASLQIRDPGEYGVVLRAIDGAGNRLVQDLTSLNIVEQGIITVYDNPVTNASTTLYYLEPNTKQYVVWQASAFGQVNPQTTSASGSYVYLAPPGTYYLEIQAPGYIPAQSKQFTLQKTTPINTAVALKPSRTLNLGFITLKFPSWAQSTFVVNTSASGENLVTTTPEDNRNLPSLSLEIKNSNPFNTTDLVGKSTILSVMATWLPQASQQLAGYQSLLESTDVQHVIIMNQQTPSQVAQFKKRGKYDSLMVADKDGILSDALEVQTLPTHYLISPTGKIQAWQQGILDAKELTELAGSASRK